jgi:hypothetical protein
LQFNLLRKKSLSNVNEAIEEAYPKADSACSNSPMSNDLLPLKSMRLKINFRERKPTPPFY